MASFSTQTPKRQKEVMLNKQHKDNIIESWRLVVPIAETAADLFYKRLFELRPDYRRFFPSDMTAQKRKLLATLAFVVKAIDWPEDRWRDDVSAEEDLYIGDNFRQKLEIWSRNPATAQRQVE